MQAIFSDITSGLYTMWFVNFLVGGYAIYSIYRVGKFTIKIAPTLGESGRLNDMRILQCFSSIAVLIMFLAADIWAMSYYTQHTLAPLEFFYYAFDAAVVHHLLSELLRMEYAHHNNNLI